MSRLAKSTVNKTQDYEPVLWINPEFEDRIVLQIFDNGDLVAQKANFESFMIEDFQSDSAVYVDEELSIIHQTVRSFDFLTTEEKNDLLQKYQDRNPRFIDTKSGRFEIRHTISDNPIQN